MLGKNWAEAFGPLFIIAFLCTPVSAQTTNACRADLKHLTLPASAQVNDGDELTPLKFLFSKDGDDIYSAIPSGRSHNLTWISNHGIRVIIVYQDEQARQKTINILRQPGVMAGIYGPHAPLENLKFAVVHLVQEGDVIVGDEHQILTGSWAVKGISCFEPQACESHPHQDFCAEGPYMGSPIVPCVLPGLHAAGNEDNWIGDMAIYKQLKPYWDPQFVRTIKAMQKVLKEYANESVGR